MMAQTEREAVIKHIVEKQEIKFNDTIDMAVYLKRDQMETNPELSGSKTYVDQVLAAGYKSKVAKQLFDDINKAMKAAGEDPEAEATDE